MVERVSIEPLRNLLRSAAPAKSLDLDDLFQRLSPVCELDPDAESILFQADADQNLIRIGLKCTIRLHAHALAAGVIFDGIDKLGSTKMDQAKMRSLFGPADKLLTWAVGRDLQQALKQIEAYQRELDHVLHGAEKDIDEELLSSLSHVQRGLGECIFRYASAYIILHELGHLNSGHKGCTGYRSIEQEKEADWFAANWLLEAANQTATNPQTRRMKVLLGIAVALLWPTVLNVFLGHTSSNRHPEGYDRLFQVLDREIDGVDSDEYQVVWHFVSTLLINHMWAANFNFDEFDTNCMQGGPRDEVNYLIDLIASQDRLR